MAWFDFLRKKSQPAPGSQSFFILGGDSAVTRTLDAYLSEGYAGNPIVYSRISVIAKNAASVKLEVKQGDADKVLTTHPLLDLLRKPNPTQNWKEFAKELVTFHQAAGEAFVIRYPATGPAQELYCLDPRYVEVERDKGGSAVPAAYLYGTGENKKRYRVNPLTGECQVLHIKGANPLNTFRGLSGLSASAVAVDTHNAGGRWNKNLLANSARPSGVLELGASVHESTLQQIKTHFHRAWQGAGNAGSVPVLTGGAKFTALSHNPKDMDFSLSMTEAAKNIALVFGVPLPLVTTEAATFSNMEAALERLWSDTVLPLLDEVIEALSDFLAPAYGKGLTLQYNADSVPALEAKRARKFERMWKAVDAGLLTPNEARVEVGFDESDEEGADKLYMKGTMKPMEKLGEDPPPPAAPAADEPATGLAKAMKDAGFDPADVVKAMREEFGVKDAA
ncbi:phage portal protein [Methylorubrum sp. SB2]|uniref:phage portal protein n=1 Tax=Methylorubrum subtropicum TaxID=3138812 RepID=UPI00313B171E